MRSRIAALWLRAKAWLRREAYVRASVVEAAKQAYLEGHASGLAAGHHSGYVIGRAHGQLEGRMALAEELEVAFGVDARSDLTVEDVKRVRASQVH